MGAEYILNEMLFFRGGYRFNYDSEGLTFGLGVKYALGGSTMSFSYTYLDYQVLTQVNMFSFGLSL